MRKSSIKENVEASEDLDALSQKQSLPESPNAFIEEANKPQITLMEEFIYLVVNDRKWWLIPLMLSLVFVAIAVALTQSAIVPFVYTLF
jgi:hypothetical protein